MFPVLIFCCLLALSSAGKSPHGDEYLSTLTLDQFSKIPPEIIEDSMLDVPGLVTKYGYPAETHEIQTEDNYIVTLHRIAGDKHGNINGNRPVVLLVHGLMGSSSDWVVNGPETGLGYILADEGYDVWMGNVRGNYYSKKHKTLNPKTSRKYWMFSWHEMGQYDIPAMIDYILMKTSQNKLHYIGHSQGTTAFFVMCTLKPEYNEKIISMHALAPVAYMKNAKNVLMNALSKYATSGEYILTLLGFNEVLPKTKFLSSLAHKYCHEDTKLIDFCIFLIFGNGNMDQVNKTMLPLYYSHVPAGASSRQYVHYAQEHVSGKFRQFDYGFIANLMIYGSFNPPSYKLKYLTAPIALHYGEMDLSTDPIDIKRLYNELKNPIGLFRVPQDTFGHVDFLWAMNVKTLVYNKVLSIMKSYDMKV